MTTDRHAVAARVGVAVVLLMAASLAMFWPGYVAYDSLAQYRQALSGSYDDWHPPAMAHLWSLFGPAGPAPMLVVQMALYWAGFGLLAAGVVLCDRRRAALALLIVALWPPLLGWQAVVLKDTQMLGAMLAGVGVLGWWRLRDRPAPAAAWIVAGVLFGYALLVRANAPLSVVPLIVMLSPWPQRVSARLALGVGGITLAIALAGPINHRLLGGAASGVERTQAIYDLAGIGVATGDTRVGLTAAAITQLRVKACVRPFFWDPLGEPGRCEQETAALRALPVGTLYGSLAAAAMRHPIAYAAHRLAHLNSTLRWIVPVRWYGAPPPAASEANDHGFGEPGPAAQRWQGTATWLVETPLGWPVLWVTMGIGGLFATRSQTDGAAHLARALFVSALVQEASFAAISIASDWRYHLWPMTAVAIGWIMLGRWPRSRALWLATGVVLAAGGTARWLLPEAPQSYHAMLG